MPSDTSPQSLAERCASYLRSRFPEEAKAMANLRAGAGMERPEYRDDPFLLAKLCWPEVTFYDRQREIIESVRDNEETICVAGNVLGKDFTAGFIALSFFLTRTPVRVVTT